MVATVRLYNPVSGTWLDYDPQDAQRAIQLTRRMARQHEARSLADAAMWRAARELDDLHAGVYQASLIAATPAEPEATS